MNNNAKDITIKSYKEPQFCPFKPPLSPNWYVAHYLFSRINFYQQYNIITFLNVASLMEYMRMLRNSCKELSPVMGNMAMQGQISSEKCCSSTSLLCSTHIGMSRSRSYSNGAKFGNLVHTFELLVDQANVCAEPQATFVIFLP